MKLSAAEVAEALGVAMSGGLGRGETIFERVSTDTREDLKGCLFVALRGERFDGHDYLAEAAGKGALGAVVSRGETPAGLVRFKVEDTLTAYGALGLAARMKLNAQVGAITGSFGKTTTKDFAARIIASSGYKVLSTSGNLNNRVGAPRTLLGAEGDEKFAVIELGISEKGEMTHLTRGLRPDAALVTGVGAAHTEGLGDVETVASEKMKIAEGLEMGGTLILPHGDSLLRPQAWLKERGIRLLTFGWEDGADVRGEDLVSLGSGGSRFRIGKRLIHVGLPGRYNASNALAAWALAKALGVEVPDGAEPLQDIKASPLRGEMRTTPWGAKVLVDCYNANPRAVAAALETLKDLSNGARMIAVLGEMRELGALSESCHEEMGRRAAQTGVERLLLFGSGAAPALKGARDAGIAEGAAMLARTREEIVGELRSTGRPGDWILIKGSRFMRLDMVAEAITAKAGERE